ncbi:MAG: metal ABC transporter solute-binding protein, Zn/Mn family [Acidimicrobiia bacterium]
MRFDNDSHYNARLRIPARIAAATAAATILMTACTDTGVDAGTQRGQIPVVIATTSILGDVVSQITDGGVDLRILIPSGVDPHDFAPSAQQVASISAAELIVANGLGLEEGLTDILAQATSEGLTVIEAGSQVDPLTVSNGTDDSGLDPHFWQDPIRMKRAVQITASALEEIGVAGVERNALDYQAELDAVDAEIASLLAPLPPERRVLVTNHDAFRYFADRYGFEIIGTIIPGGSTLGEPSSADLAGLVQVIIDNDVPAIFVENVGNPGLAEAIAAEVGREIEVVQLISDALGEPGSPTGTYLDMLRTNAGAIAGALGNQD